MYLGGKTPSWAKGGLKNLVADSTLDLVQYFFRRNFKTVDRELRDVFIERIEGTPGTNLDELTGPTKEGTETFLSHGQSREKAHKQSYKISSDTYANENDLNLEIIPPSDVAHAKQSVEGLFRAVVDESPETIVAYRWDVASNELLKKHAEDSDSLARIVISEQGNEKIATFVKAIMFPFLPREIIMTIKWFRRPSNRALIMTWRSSPDVVLDYGSNQQFVRGTAEGYIEVRPFGKRRSSITAFQSLNSNGSIPKFLGRRKLYKTFESFILLHQRFNRVLEIATEERKELVQKLKTLDADTARYSDLERAAFDTPLHLQSPAVSRRRTLRTTSKIASTKTVLVKSLHRLQKDFLVTTELKDGEGNACFGSSEVVVDEAAEECVAWELLPFSGLRMIDWVRKGGVRKESHSTSVNDHHVITKATLGFTTKQVRRRVFECDAVFKKNEQNEWSISTVPIDAKQDRKTAVLQHIVAETVRGTLRSQTTFTPLQPTRGGIPQTRIVDTFQIDLAGLKMPHTLVHSAAQSLIFDKMAKVRKFFDKSAAKDEHERSHYVKIFLKTGENNTTPEEEAIFHSACKRIVEFDGITRKKKMNSHIRMAESSIAYIPGERMAWGHSVAEVSASPEEVLAYFWDFDSRHSAKPDTVKKLTVEEVNAHNKVNYMIKIASNTAIAPRDVLFRCLWRKWDNGGGIDYVMQPIKDPRYPENNSDGLVRALYPTIVTLKNDVKKGKTVVNFLCQLDFGGSDHSGLVSFFMSFYMKQQLKRTTILQQYFQRLRKLETFDADDGIAIGETLMMQEDRQQHASLDVYVTHLVASHIGLSELVKVLDWFPSLLLGMLNNWMHDTTAVKTRLNNLTQKEAFAIGKSLSISLRQRKQAESGVAQWMSQYPAIMELSESYPWFLPLARTIGKRKLEQAPWGMYFRVGVGAVISLSDVATDINTVILFLRNDKAVYAYATLSMIALTLVLQLALLYTVRKKGSSIRHTIGEVLSIVFCVKPMVDAYKIVMNQKRSTNSHFDPMMGFIANKLIEVCCESIPGAVMQGFVYLQGGVSTQSSQQVVSIGISVLTVAYTSTVLSLDYDLSANRRAAAPTFYGYVPNDGRKRLLVMLTMLAGISCHVALRMACMAMLAAVGGAYMFIYVVGDLAFYLGYKVFRRDFRYWVPTNSEVESFLLSLSSRIVIKIVADYANIVHFVSSF